MNKSFSNNQSTSSLLSNQPIKPPSNQINYFTMFSKSALLSLASLSVLSLAAATPIARQNSHFKDCAGKQWVINQTRNKSEFESWPLTPFVRRPGDLCLINGQDANGTDISLTNTFSFSAAGKTGLSNELDYLTMDFQPAQRESDQGEYHGIAGEFSPLQTSFSRSEDSEANVFFKDGVAIPCGLDGKAFINVSSHLEFFQILQRG